MALSIPSFGQQRLGGYGRSLQSQQYPTPQMLTPRQTTTTYPGTQAGKLWYQTTKGDIEAGKKSEKRALAGQKKQVEAAQQARQRTLEGSGYQAWEDAMQNLTPTYSEDYRQRVESLKPTYDQATQDTMLGQQRDIFEGQSQAQKRGIEAGSGGRPTGATQSRLQAADVAKTGLYGRAAAELGMKKAEQDRIDTVQKLGLLADIGQMDKKDALQRLESAYEKTLFDYGVESDLANAIERIYATTIAKTPDYNWGKLKKITEQMAEPQEYSVGSSYHGSASEGVNPASGNIFPEGFGASDYMAKVRSGEYKMNPSDYKYLGGTV